jgi:DNA mismatch endonuclease (patch repair protein)
MIGAAPKATSHTARRTMEANRRSETGPERLLRSALHTRGLRFRKDRRLCVSERWVRPDIVFGPRRVAVFVDGCFWHRCPTHATHPRANAAFWQAKFDRTVTRDRADDLALQSAGWTVIRVWEHEGADTAAQRIEKIVRTSTWLQSADGLPQ